MNDTRTAKHDVITVERRKISDAANRVEELSVMIKEAVLDLRDDARHDDITTAYARVYVLRRELSRVVASLGAGVPVNGAVMRRIEKTYDSLVRD